MNRLTDEELILELKRRFEENKKALADLKEMTDQLKQLNRKLEESESLKTHFISNITNEIINPFAAILGLSRNILISKNQDWDKVFSMVALIHSEAFNLDFQLKNIFAAARLEAGEITPEIFNVDIFQLIQQTIDNFKHESDKKKMQIIFDFDISPGIEKTFYFRTDPELLKLIMNNLISNSINYSTENGKIEIKTWIENEMLHIAVKDYGIGIDEENHQRIFDRFTRLDTAINSVNRGHGLGLSINKAIVELLNGKIWVNSKAKQGAMFVVALPEMDVPNDLAGFTTDENDFLFTNDSKEVF